MKRALRPFLFLLTLFALSMASAVWNVASAHPAAHSGQMISQSTVPDRSLVASYETVAAKSCFEVLASTCKDDAPGHMGTMCCAAIACHMAVLPPAGVTVSRVFARAIDGFTAETSAEGMTGPRLERPPRTIAV